MSGLNNRDTERGLFGNGSLTIASRLSSAIGIPAIGVVLTWLSLQLWEDVQALKAMRTEFMVAITEIKAELIAKHEVDTLQNARIDRLIDRLPPRNYNSPAPGEVR